MNKYFLSCMAALMCLTMVSCSSDDNNEGGEDATFANYKVVVTQETTTENLQNYIIVASMAGGYPGGMINDQTKKNVGLAYNLSDEEDVLPTWSFTSEGKVVDMQVAISYQQLSDYFTQGEPFNVTIKLYRDGKEIETVKELISLKPGDSKIVQCGANE